MCDMQRDIILILIVTVILTATTDKKKIDQEKLRETVQITTSSLHY